MASSEFILAPRIDEAKARQEMQKLDDVARRSARQMEMEFSDAWDHFEKKGESSFKKLGGKLQGFMGSFAGNLAANVVSKAAEIATDAATKVFEDAEGFSALGRERYEKNRDINSEADALGIGRGRYAALDIAGVASGLDQSDIRGLLSGFVGALEKPEMIQFKEDAEKNGIDKAFLNFMSAMSRMSTEKAAQHMNDVFGDDDALKGSKFIKPIKELASKGQSLSFQNIIDTMAGRHIDIEQLEKSLNMTEEQMKDLFANDAKTLETQINNTAKLNNAKDIVTSENSTHNVQEKHLENLHIKVQGQLIADGIEKAEIGVGSAVVNSSATWISEKSKQADDVVGARDHMFDDFEHYKRYLVKLSRFLSFDNSIPDIKDGESVHAYLERRRKEGSMSGPTSSLVEQTEEHAERNKNRTDTGPQAMK